MKRRATRNTMNVDARVPCFVNPAEAGEDDGYALNIHTRRLHADQMQIKLISFPVDQMVRGLSANSGAAPEYHSAGSLRD